MFSFGGFEPAATSVTCRVILGKATVIQNRSAFVSGSMFPCTFLRCSGSFLAASLRSVSRIFLDILSSAAARTSLLSYSYFSHVKNR
jgi:hypothetical protein